MNDKIYNWGLVGAGRISGWFAEGLKHTRNGRAYAIASRSTDKAKQFAAERNIPVAYGSYEELAADPKVDIIYIGTPNALHAPNSILMMAHKKPVLCEKSFAVTRPEADDMIAAARQHDVFLMEALWTHFLPTMTLVRKIIADGTIGDITCIKADFGFFRAFDPQARVFNPALGGSSMLDIGLYPVYLAVALLGFPDKVMARAVNSPVGPDLTASLFLTWNSGPFAHLLSTFCANIDTEAKIFGTKGKITMHHHFHMPTKISVTVDGQTTDYPSTAVGNGYNYEAQEVMDCLSKGLKESPLLPLSFSARFMSLLDTIRQQF